MTKIQPPIQVRTSEDGSSTLYRADIDEHYHSYHGAVQESMHVFIEAGLKHHPGKELSLLEIGFGTGLNALLTMLNGSNRNIIYHAIEKYPLSTKLISEVNYPVYIKHPCAARFFSQLHSAPWNIEKQLTPSFTLYKQDNDLLQFSMNTHYDLIYFDAFAPDKQPDLWTPEIFIKIAECMNPNAILTTYSTKGSVKRAIKSAGLTIEKIPGPPGKREILRAWK